MSCMGTPLDFCAPNGAHQDLCLLPCLADQAPLSCDRGLRKAKLNSPSQELAQKRQAKAPAETPGCDPGRAGLGPRQILFNILLSAWTPALIVLCLAWSSRASLPWSSDHLDRDLAAAEHAVPDACCPSKARILRSHSGLMWELQVVEGAEGPAATG